MGSKVIRIYLRRIKVKLGEKRKYFLGTLSIRSLDKREQKEGRQTSLG